MPSAAAADLYGYPLVYWLLGFILVRLGSEAATRIRNDAPRRDAIRKRKTITGQALSDLAGICFRDRIQEPQNFNRIQEHVLEAICSHAAHQVRAPQGALAANLLIPDGDDLVVIARHGGGRPTPARHRRDTLFCAKVFELRETISIGDVRSWEGSQRPVTVPYRDVLAVPIFGASDEVLAVVAIDSERPFDFARKENALRVGLSPYVNLLKVLILLEQRMAATSGG